MVKSERVNKLVVFAICTAFAFAAFTSQKSVNTNKKGVLIDGYDVVSYFKSNPQKGEEMFSHEYKGATLWFANAKNRETFTANPTKYMPQYGGWCAYAMGTDGTLVEIDPKTYEIRNGKFYLFYNKWGTNTLKLWLEEGPEELRRKADENWTKHQ